MSDKKPHKCKIAIEESGELIYNKFEKKYEIRSLQKKNN